jgi:hypothetical protein
LHFVPSSRFHVLSSVSIIFCKQIAEVVLPALFVYILVALKNQAQSSGAFASKMVGASFPEVSFMPLTFTDYVTALRASRVCVTDGTTANTFNISGIDSYGDNWQVPLVKCDSRKCQQAGQDARPFCEYAMIAVTGTGAGGPERAYNFKAWLESTYPVITNRAAMPFDFDLVQLFTAPDDMNNYVAQSDYGGFVATGGTNGSGSTYVPKIAMGIVWQGNNASAYNYQLRPNSTNFNAPEQAGRPATATTPTTKKLTDSFARNDYSVCVPIGGTPTQGIFEASCTGQYMYNGVLTFQRLVNDFILWQTGAAAAGYKVGEAGMQYTAFPTRPYLKNGFFSTIARTFFTV